MTNPAPNPTPDTPKAAPPAPTQGRDVFDALRSEIDRLFDDVILPGVGSGARRLTRLGGRASGWLPGFSHVPAADLVERNGEYELSVDLPGLEESEIAVSVEKGMLHLKAEKSVETAKEEGDFHMQERCSGLMERSLTLPPDVDPEKIAARYAKGVLTITLPKSGKPVSGERKITVQSA